MTPTEKCFQDCLQFIAGRDNFLLTTHMNADGDAYGAVLALNLFLRERGKRCRIILHDQDPDSKYQFISGWESLESFHSGIDDKFGGAIIVDVPTTARIGDPAAVLPPAADCLKIDHHPVEEDFAAVNLIDTDASSTCSLVYEVISRSSVKLDLDLANALMCGIMYDTGRFSFSNTGRRDMEIAAALLDCGVRPHRIANEVFFSTDPASLRVIGYGLANLELHLDGRICVILLPGEVMGEGALDLDELANYSLAVKGVEVGMFIRQVRPDLVKASLRSRGGVDVNRVARRFGGGGHLHAAGCRSQNPPEIFKAGLLAAVREQLTELHPSASGKTGSGKS